MAKEKHRKNKALDALWTKNDKRNYKYLSRRVRRFNHLYFSAVRMRLFQVLEITLHLLPTLVSLGLFLVCIFLSDQLLREIIRDYSEEQLFTMSLTITGIGASIFGAIFIPIIFSLKGKDLFRIPESKLFWQSNGIFAVNNSHWLIHSFICFLFLLIPLLFKSYSNALFCALWIVVDSLFILIEYIRYTKKTDKERCVTYLKTQSYLRANTKSITILENRIIRDSLSSSKTIDSNLKKLLIIESRRFHAHSFLEDELIEKAREETDVKLEQNILKAFLDDQSKRIKTPMQLYLFASFCLEYCTAINKEQIPAESLLDKERTKKAIVMILMSALDSFKKRYKRYPIDYSKLPNLFILDDDQTSVFYDCIDIEGYYAFSGAFCKQSLKIAEDIASTCNEASRKDIGDSLAKCKEELFRFAEGLSQLKYLNEYAERHKEKAEALLEKIKQLNGKMPDQ